MIFLSFPHHIAAGLVAWISQQGVNAVDIDREKLEMLRKAYLSVGDMIKLTATAQLDDEDGKELNLSYFSSLMGLLNAEFHRLAWGDFEQNLKFAAAKTAGG